MVSEKESKKTEKKKETRGEMQMENTL